MPRLQLHAEHPEPRKIDRGVALLRAGEVVAYPTDTVYALGVDLGQRKAIDRLYEVKRMPRDKPLALLCPDLSDIARYALVHNQAYRIMRRLLPGPYTFILEASREVPRILWSKRKTIGIRVPAHAVPMALLKALGGPIVSSSAMWEDEPLNDPEDIDDRFPGLALILDAGYGGLEPSTIVDLTGDEILILREGAGPVDQLG